MSPFWNERSVLITGLTGFIGCWLAGRLCDLGARVVGYDLDQHHALDLHPGLRERIALVRGDIFDTAALTAVFRDQAVNTCFHLAGQSMIESGVASPAKTFDVNVRGTWSVLEAARGEGVERIVVASSNTVYGPQSHRPTAEDAPLAGRHPYAASKACTDIIARSYAKTFDMHVTVCRQTNTFGGADPHWTHIVPSTIMSLLRGEPPVIKSDGTPTKAYLFVEDTIAGYVRLAERAHEPGVSGEAFNITAEEPVSVLELVKAIIAVSGVQVAPRVTGTAETTRQEHEHLSTAKAKSVLGWEARYALQAGLAKTVAWYRDNRGLYEATMARQRGRQV